MGWWPWGGGDKNPEAPGQAAESKPTSGCPVMHSRSGGAVRENAGEHPLTKSSCPVPPDQRRDHPMILLDPRLDRNNNMLAGGESQYPGLGQRTKLPTQRIVSTIPRSDEHNPAHQEGTGYLDVRL